MVAKFVTFICTGIKHFLYKLLENQRHLVSVIPSDAYAETYLGTEGN
jgi:hypothetical protein